MGVSRPILRHRRWRALVFVPVLALLALSAWAFASPVGASPDDDFHLASIWCGAGERAGLCESAPQADERTIPKSLQVQSVCYVNKPTASAACQGAHFGTTPDVTIVTDRGNFAGDYPPLFYFVMSAFAGPNVSISVLAMRTVNALLFVGLTTALFFLLPQRRRAVLVGGLAISLVPLGLFLLPSTNPSSWAVISAGLVWLSLVGFFESSGRRKIGLGALATIGAVMGAGARADSAVYTAIAAACAVVLTFTPRRRYLLQLALPLAIIVIAVGFYLASGQSTSGATGLPSSDGTIPKAGIHWGLAASNLVNIPGLWVGVFGSWALGWFDVVLPNAVWVGGFASFVAIVIVGLSTRFRRKVAVVVMVAAALVAIPAAILAASGAAVGSYVQPRYILPLIIMLAGLALLSGRTGDLRFTPVQLWTVAAVISLGNALSLYTTVRRYVVGTDSRALDLDASIEWWWNIPISPMAMVVIGSIAFAAMAALIARAASEATNSASRLEAGRAEVAL